MDRCQAGFREDRAVLKFPELTSEQVRAYVSQRFPDLHESGGWYRGPCPIHNGSRESFGIEIETGAAKCFSECDRGWDIYGLEAELTDRQGRDLLESVAELVGLHLEERSSPEGGRKSDPPPRNRPPAAAAATERAPKVPLHERIVDCYDYRDATGRLVYQQVRLENPKDFRVRRPVEGNWCWSIGAGKFVQRSGGDWFKAKPGEEGAVELPELSRIPYRLENVLEEPTVVICEGEKDAEAVTALGLCGTTTGAWASWNADCAKYFAGKRVAILPDADTDGWKYAANVARDLAPIADAVKVVFLPGLKNQLASKGDKLVSGEDVSDWISRGGDRAQLIGLIKSRSIDVRRPDEAERILTGPIDMSWADELPRFSDLRWREREWLTTELIPLGHFCYVVGASGSLKTTWVTDLCRTVATGGMFANAYRSRKLPILTLDLENGEAELADMRKRIGANGLQAENWRFWGMFHREEPPSIDDPRILEWARQEKGLIVFDSLVRFHDGSEKDNDELKLTNKKFRALTNVGATVIVIHHAGKSEESKYRGGTEIRAGADTMISIVRDDNEPTRVRVEHLKIRGAKEQRGMVFDLGEEGFDAGAF